MTADERAALRELALAATPGPWKGEDKPHSVGFVRRADGTVIMSCLKEADAAYIAACHPAAIVALLSALDAAEAERDKSLLCAAAEAKMVDTIAAERDAAIARAEAVEGLLQRCVPIVELARSDAAYTEDHSDPDSRDRLLKIYDGVLQGIRALAAKEKSNG